MKALSVFVLILFSSISQAQNYPNKPIRWVVPYTVGGTPEQTSKFLADEITKWAKVITTAGVKAEQ